MLDSVSAESRSRAPDPSFKNSNLKHRIGRGGLLEICIMYICMLVLLSLGFIHGHEWLENETRMETDGGDGRDKGEDRNEDVDQGIEVTH